MLNFPFSLIGHKSKDKEQIAVPVDFLPDDYRLFLLYLWSNITWFSFLPSLLQEEILATTHSSWTTGPAWNVVTIPFDRHRSSSMYNNVSSQVFLFNCCGSCSTQLNHSLFSNVIQECTWIYTYRE